jgi:hypothetical protein
MGKYRLFSKDFLVHLLCCIQVGFILYSSENFITENKFWEVKTGELSSVTESFFLAYDFKPDNHGSQKVSSKVCSRWQNLLLLRGDELC